MKADNIGNRDMSENIRQKMEFMTEPNMGAEVGLTQPTPVPTPEKSLGQIAYEKYAYYQLRIPRMQIRPLTWEELKLCMDGDYCTQWETIAQAVAKAAVERDNGEELKTLQTPQEGGKK